MRMQNDLPLISPIPALPLPVPIPASPRPLAPASWYPVPNKQHPTVTTVNS